MLAMRVPPRLIVLFCSVGVIVAASALPARAEQAQGCLEPWIEGCRSTTSQCSDCAAYCANRGCVVEAGDCGVDTHYCTGDNQVYEECACTTA